MSACTARRAAVEAADVHDRVASPDREPRATARRQVEPAPRHGQQPRAGDRQIPKRVDKPRRRQSRKRRADRFHRPHAEAGGDADHQRRVLERGLHRLEQAVRMVRPVGIERADVAIAREVHAAVETLAEAARRHVHHQQAGLHLAAVDRAEVARGQRAAEEQLARAQRELVAQALERVGPARRDDDQLGLRIPELQRAAYGRACPWHHSGDRQHEADRDREPRGGQHLVVHWAIPQPAPARHRERGAQQEERRADAVAGHQHQHGACRDPGEERRLTHERTPVGSRPSVTSRCRIRGRA